MTPTKPKTPKAYVTVVNPDTGKSKSTTFYDADPEPANVIKQLHAAFRKQREKSQRQPVPA